MRRHLWFLVRLLVSGAFIYYVVRTTDVASIWNVIRSVQWMWILTASPLLLVLVCITAYRWQLLLRAQGVPLPILTALKWTWVGAFFNSVMPGLTGGDLIKAYYVSKETTLRARAATSVFVDRVVGLAALLLIGALGAGLSLGDEASRKASLMAGAFLGLLVLFFAVAFSTTCLKWGERAVDTFAAWPGLSRIRGFLDILKKIHESLYAYRSTPTVLVVCVVLSLWVHAMVVALNVLIARALGAVTVSWVQFALFIPVINAMMIIPLHVGGLGPREAMYKHFFGAEGMLTEQAVALSLLVYACQLGMNLIGGIVYLFAKTKDPASVDVDLHPGGEAK